jgi:hypothetical protein
MLLGTWSSVVLTSPERASTASCGAGFSHARFADRLSFADADADLDFRSARFDRFVDFEVVRGAGPPSR